MTGIIFSHGHDGWLHCSVCKRVPELRRGKNFDKDGICVLFCVRCNEAGEETGRGVAVMKDQEWRPLKCEYCGCHRFNEVDKVHICTNGWESYESCDLPIWRTEPDTTQPKQKIIQTKIIEEV